MQLMLPLFMVLLVSETTWSRVYPIYVIFNYLWRRLFAPSFCLISVDSSDVE